MSCLGVVVNVLFYFAKLPEVAQVVATDTKEVVSVKGFMKKYHTIAGFFAEFAYVGAQVAVASFTIFYITEQPGISPPISNATASNMFSACQAVFTVGRFIGVVYLKYVDPAFALFVNGIGLILFSILTATIPGKDLGSYAKLGSGLLSAGVSGGAAWPSMTGAVADNVNTHTAFLIPMIGFIPLMLYGLVMWITRSRKYAGRITIWQTQVPLKSEAAVETALAPTGSVILDETKGEEEFVETASSGEKRKL
ncbi:hypothetical protein QFC19_007329 [Naganishia cerealis]|uniref:Uncharacterized protein n=1 Tax=Naganishia cerealis TaxID=610337 RepID=A0ACC2VAF3_9TREE|nr:hypothetical protein QFC19_007329 [Naganishia cerealis]